MAFHVRKRWLALAAVGIMTTMVEVPASAQLFGLMEVHDSVSIAQLSSILTKTLAQLKVAEQTYDVAMEMKQRLSHADRALLMSVAPKAVQNLTHNTLGETEAWSATINGNAQLAEQAWRAATVPVRITPGVLAQLPDAEAARSRVAAIEMQNGASVQCLQVISNYQADLQKNSASLEKLASRVLDDSDESNSNIEQLNELNLANVQRLHQSEQANLLHSCEVQQQIISNAAVQNQLVAPLNSQQAVREELQSAVRPVPANGQQLNSYEPK